MRKYSGLALIVSILGKNKTPSKNARELKIKSIVC